jgi:hypothetical protein
LSQTKARLSGEIIPEQITMEKAFHQQSSREMQNASLATE